VCVCVCGEGKCVCEIRVEETSQCIMVVVA